MNLNGYDSSDQNHDINSNNNAYLAEINEPVPTCMYPHTRNTRYSNRPGVHFDTDFIDENADSFEHFKSLATQTLTSLRDMVSERHRSKKSSLVEIYRHFDRDGKGYFNAQDFQEATSDLRIETSSRVADMAITQIALDGHDKVCYGEFLVFIHDVHHKTLEQFVQNQMAQQYERQGKSFPNDFHAYFVNEERKNRGIRGNVNFQEDEQDGFVDIKAFVSILQKLGLKLETVDVNRLVTRFDVSGSGKTCSCKRFVRMVEGCEVWKKAEDVLRNQEEVGLEADAIRSDQNRGNNSRNIDGDDNSIPLSEEIIDMAEYLGIKVISENYLLWIVRDALNAALPLEWIILKDSKGRSFFHNRSTNDSRWDHPADPHFRRLRDQHKELHQAQQEQQGNLSYRDNNDPLRYLNKTEEKTRLPDLNNSTRSVKTSRPNTADRSNSPYNSEVYSTANNNQSRAKSAGSSPSRNKDRLGSYPNWNPSSSSTPYSYKDPHQISSIKGTNYKQRKHYVLHEGRGGREIYGGNTVIYDRNPEHINGENTNTFHEVSDKKSVISKFIDVKITDNLRGKTSKNNVSDDNKKEKIDSNYNKVIITAPRDSKIEKKLAFMFDDNVISRLDTVINRGVTPTPSSDKNQQNGFVFPMKNLFEDKRNNRRRGHGGIVIM